MAKCNQVAPIVTDFALDVIGSPSVQPVSPGVQSSSLRDIFQVWGLSILSGSPRPTVSSGISIGANYGRSPIDVTRFAPKCNQVHLGVTGFAPDAIRSPSV